MSKQTGGMNHDEAHLGGGTASLSGRRGFGRLFGTLERKFNGPEVRADHRADFLARLEEVRSCTETLAAALRDERMRKHSHYTGELARLIGQTREALDGVQCARSAFQEDLKFFRKSYYDLMFVRWGSLYKVWLALGAPPCRGRITADQTALVLLPALEPFQEELELAIRKVTDHMQSGK